MENHSTGRNNPKPLLHRGLGKLPAWLKNKYFLCSAGFIAWMLFFDPRDLFTQLEHSRELKQLQASKAYYQEEIARETTELQQLKSNPALVEKYAREKYLMKRDNEDLFLIPENPGPENN